MKCSNCGSENPEGSIFCGTCGAEFKGNVLTMKENDDVHAQGQIDQQKQTGEQAEVAEQVRPARQPQINAQEQPYGQTATKPKKAKKAPLFVKIISVVVAVLIVCGGVFVAFGKDIEISVFGSKKYYEAIETRQFSSLSNLQNAAVANSDIKAFSLNCGVKLLEENASDYSETSAGSAMKSVADGIYAMFSKKDSDYSSDLDSSDSAESYKAEQNVVNNVTLNMNVCKNQAAKSIFAKCNVNYKSKSILSAFGSIDSKSIKFKIPELSDKSFGQNVDQASMQKIIDELTGSKQNNSAKELQAEYKKIFDNVYSEVTNSDIKIEKRQQITVNGSSLNCDKITVYLTQEKLRKMCVDLLNGIKNSQKIKDYLQTSMSYRYSLDGGIDSEIEELISAVKSANIGDFTMTVYAKGDYFNSEIVSRTIECGKGCIKYGNMFYNGKGNASLTLTSAGSPATIKFPYTYQNKVLNGTLSLANSAYSDSSDKTTVDLKVDLNAADSLGLYPCRVCVNSSSGSDTNSTCFELSNSGKQSVFTLSLLKNNKESAEVKLGVTPSADTFTVPSMSNGTLGSDDISGMTSKWRKICEDNGIGK